MSYLVIYLERLTEINISVWTEGVDVENRTLRKQGFFHLTDKVIKIYLEK
jgi:hypothetical protein